MTDVFHEEVVHASPEAFAQLAAEPAVWLSDSASSVSEKAERVDARLRARFGDGPLHVTVQKRARIELGDVVRKKNSVTVPLTWEASGYAGMFPVMDATMQVIRVSPSTSRIVFWGRYDPPLGRPGRMVDRYVAHQVARMTVRGFVHAVARRLAELEPPLAG